MTSNSNFSLRVEFVNCFSCSRSEVQQKTKIRVCSSTSLWVKFNFELLESFLCHSCVKFSLWSVHLFDIKEFETTHLFINFTTSSKSVLHSLCYTLHQIFLFIRTMTVSWNSQCQNVDRLFYFARDLILIIFSTQEMTSKQKYLKQREWIDFCVRKQNLLQKTMKRI